MESFQGKGEEKWTNNQYLAKGAAVIRLSFGFCFCCCGELEISRQKIEAQELSIRGQMGLEIEARRAVTSVLEAQKMA